MARRFLYNPFSTEKDDDLKYEDKNSQLAKRTIVASGLELRWDLECMPLYPWIKSPSGYDKPLKKVGKDDIVVINVHGHERRAAVGYHTGEIGNDGTQEIRLMNAAGLAEMIVLDGLDKNHRVIKLNSCYGAGGGSGGNIKVDVSFAATLAQNLGVLGYKRIRVGAYEGKLNRMSSNLAAGKYIGDPEKGEAISAKQLRRHWFGPDGEEVDSPFPDKEAKKDVEAAKRAAENARIATTGGHVIASPKI